MYFVSKIDEKALYLHANIEAPKKREDLLQAGMLVEDSPDVIFSEAVEDKEAQQQCLKRIVASSVIHKSVSFKHTNVQIENANIGRNVQIGANVTIQNCVILNNVVIGDKCELIN